MPFITAQDSTEIYYRDWGTGIPVVLIHGWPLNGDMWEKQATFLVEHNFRVVTYDRRGFGRSGQPWHGYDYDTFATDLHDLMNRLNLREAVLVGFSMGGGEVVRYLNLYGDSRVNKAVLVSSVTPCLQKTHGNPEGVDAKVFGEMDAAIRKDRPAFLKDFAQKFYGRTAVKHTVSEALLEWHQAMAFAGSLWSTLAAANAWSMTDFREDMKQITIPVRVIHGTSDATVPIDVAGRRSVKILSNATLTEYEGEPHGLFITAADRLNQELLEFLGGETDPHLTTKGMPSS